MNLPELKPLAGLPVCCAVRRTSLAGGVVAALLTGGLPFIGCESGLIMGRATLLPSPLAFVLHLLLALLYGAVFCLAISRSRDGWTILAAAGATLSLYAGNLVATQSWHLPRLLSESDALFARLVFGAAFTVFFKLAEIGEANVSAAHTAR